MKTQSWFDSLADRKLLAKARRLGGHRTRVETINAALAEYIYYHGLQMDTDQSSGSNSRRSKRR